MMNNSFIDREELSGLGLKSFGEDVKISRHARLYDPGSIEIGSHVRIDDFCILSGNITIGSFVHISAGAMIFANGSFVEIDDFVAISAGARVFSITEDLHSGLLTNPTVPNELRKIKRDKVRIEKHVVVGTLSTVLPGLQLSVGSVLGANSLLIANTEPWKIYSGNPAKFLSDRPVIDHELEMKAFETIVGGTS